jgi:hypothetical protein
MRRAFRFSSCIENCIFYACEAQSAKKKPKNMLEKDLSGPDKATQMVNTSTVVPDKATQTANLSS